MNRQKMNQIASDIVREEKNTKEVILTGKVLDDAVQILDSVMVDRGYMKQCVEEIIINSSGKGLFNAVLKLFGFKAIRTDMSIQFKEDDSRNRIDSMLKLDERTYKSVVSKMASFLAEYEKESEEEHKSKVNRINELVTLLDEREREVTQVKVDSNAQFQLVVNWIQDTLGMLGRADSDNPLGGQLNGLMKNLDIEAYWSAEGAPFREAAMFRQIKVEEESKYKEIPCLVCNDEVIAQGIKFSNAEMMDEKEVHKE